MDAENADENAEVAGYLQLENMNFVHLHGGLSFEPSTPIVVPPATIIITTNPCFLIFLILFVKNCKAYLADILIYLICYWLC